MLHRVVTAGLLALGAGTALAETPAPITSSHVSDVADVVSDAAPRAIELDGFVLIPSDSDTIDLGRDAAVFYRFDWLASERSDPDRDVRFDGLLPFAYTQLLTEEHWPMLHGTVQRTVPGSRRDVLIDSTVLLGWTSDAGVMLEGGYRRYLLKLDTGDQLDRLAVDLSGPYATLSLRF